MDEKKSDLFLLKYVVTIATEVGFFFLNIWSELRKTDERAEFKSEFMSEHQPLSVSRAERDKTVLEGELYI